MNVYEYGQKIRLQTSEPFRTLAGAAINPTSVGVSVEDPSGDLTTPTATQDTDRGTGHYYTEITCSEAGEWSYHFLGTGTCVAAGRGHFKVNAQHF